MLCLSEKYIPKEIGEFMHTVFEIFEIRARVGNTNGVVFIVRTNEKNHSLPHVHAEYGKFSVSIDITNGTVLAGNLPRKNEKIAVSWVLAHKEQLMNDWKNIAISTTTTMTISDLERN